MKILETLDNLDIINSRFTGDYLTDLQESDPKYFKKMIKNYVVYETEDGIKFAKEYNYNSINSRIYYDDETPAPAITEESFIRYNLFSNNHIRFYQGSLSLGKYAGATYVIKTFDTVDYGGNYELVRDLTDDEVDFLREQAQVRDNAYIKRLRTYYKRYNDKIHTYGYWANR